MPAAVASCAVGIAPYDTGAYPPLARFGFFWSPLKIFEYMACGLPVVVFAYEGLREQVGEAERGLAVVPRDLHAFARAIALGGEGGAGWARGAGQVLGTTWRDHVAWLDARPEAADPAAGARVRVLLTPARSLRRCTGSRATAGA
jgi:glycosyltransferase involved in cell wall biosynthesis